MPNLHERHISEVPENLPQLIVGKAFKPFERVKSLPIVNLGRQESIGVMDLPFVFNGVPGYLMILAQRNAANFNHLETPLGPVSIVQRLNGDGFNDRREYTELPLDIQLNFIIQSMDQFYMLHHHEMKFNLGGLEYYLNCSGVDSAKVVNSELRRQGIFEVFDPILESKPKKPGTAVLLPWDINKLRKINATIVEKT